MSQNPYCMPINDFMEMNGFYLEQTGGGCTAYTKVLNDGKYNGFYIMITDNEDGCVAPNEVINPVLVGLYDLNGYASESFIATDSLDAIQAIHANGWR